MLQNCHGMPLALGLSYARWWGKNSNQGVVMSRLLWASAAVIALGVGTATAAELPIGMPVYHPPVLLPFTWAGPYFGVNIGGQWTNDNISTTTTGLSAAPVEAASIDSLSPGTLSSSGAIGGMQAGYNWQFDSAVVGLEVDFDGATANGNRSVSGFAGAPPGTALISTVKQPMFITTVRPRVGWAFDHVMVYATAGYAFATYQVVDQFTQFQNVQTGGGLLPVQSDVTGKLSGWTAGTGVEYAFYKGMSLKLEYLYVGLGKFDSSPIPGPVPSNAVVHHNVSDNIVRLGLNFHFGWY
jgi:outer membrane immunogenic protein